MRRVLKAILDAPPSERELKALWDFFGSKCAYCGGALDKLKREGHIDHLVAGGSNTIGNRVLACGRCNGDEKRDMPWEQFLALKASKQDVFTRRKERIMAWMKKARGGDPMVCSEQELRAQEIIDDALKSFDKAVEEMRRLRSAWQN